MSLHQTDTPIPSFPSFFLTPSSPLTLLFCLPSPSSTLPSSVHVAEERCQKLIYLNNHQECQLEQARQDLEQCRRRLLDAQVQSRGDPLLLGEGTGAAAAAAKGNKLRAAEKELKMASCSPSPVVCHGCSIEQGVNLCTKYTFCATDVCKVLHNIFQHGECLYVYTSHTISDVLFYVTAMHVCFDCGSVCDRGLRSDMCLVLCGTCRRGS